MTNDIIDENKEGEQYRKLPKINGIVHIKVSHNNMIVTVTNVNGEVICWSSPRAVGFKGSRKITQLAAQFVGSTVARKAIERGLQRVQVQVKGTGKYSDIVISAFQSAGIEITSVARKLSKKFS
jgi:small subunit ribosomal protein S11